MTSSFPAPLNDALDHMLTHFRVPAALLVAVRDGEVMTKLHGVKRLGESAPITPHTAFSIASCSKAFCAAAAGILVDEGKLRWDEAIADTVPEYVVDDSWVTSRTTVSDLLGMRTGLKREGIAEFGMDTRLPCEALLPRLRFSGRDAAFREKFTYTNSGYGAMAVLIARKSGMPYAEFLNQRVFAPLGMVDAVSCPGQLKSHHDHFYPHIQLNGVTSALPAPQCTGFEGSSCVYLSATDVAQWLRFQLEGTGALDGKTILSPDALKMTRTPQSIDHNPPPPTGENFALYCMGWQAFDFHGKKVFRHTGSEVGASTQIMFCPEERLGVAAFINIYGNGFLAMSYHIMESLMGKHVRDWITPTEAAFAKRINGELQALEDKFPLSVPPAATQMLVAYTGLYRSPLHCDAVVSVNDGTLRYEMRDCPLLNVSLTPAGEHVFTVHHDYPGMEQDLLGQRKRVRFTVDNGRAVGLSHSLLGDFTRSGF